MASTGDEISAEASARETRNHFFFFLFFFSHSIENTLYCLPLFDVTPFMIFWCFDIFFFFLALYSFLHLLSHFLVFVIYFFKKISFRIWYFFLQYLVCMWVSEIKCFFQQLFAISLLDTLNV